MNLRRLIPRRFWTYAVNSSSGSYTDTVKVHMTSHALTPRFWVVHQADRYFRRMYKSKSGTYYRALHVERFPRTVNGRRWWRVTYRKVSL